MHLSSQKFIPEILRLDPDLMIVDSALLCLRMSE